ncbi:MAG: carboxylesterase family protein [Myxococcota bacterium]
MPSSGFDIDVDVGVYRELLRDRASTKVMLGRDRVSVVCAVDAGYVVAMRWMLAAALCLAGCGDDASVGVDVGAVDGSSMDALSDGALDGTPEAGRDAGENDQGEVGPSSDLTADVMLDSGPIRGEAVDGDVLRYLGIPFALPPTGARRFAAPQPVEPWADRVDATEFGPACPQRDRTRSAFIGDEDCLQLNVWAPVAPGPHPVMVWIHGGAFIQGSATQPLYDGAPFVRSGPVVVSINYRVGALGFLASDALVDEAGVAGNYGMLDQIAALEWVQRNVARFGGDPSNVTVFGESAGGASACTLMGMPAADALFARSIIQSGGGCQNWPLLRESTPTRQSAQRIAEAVVAAAGCTDADGAETRRCLRELSAESLVDAQFMAESSGLGLPDLGPNIDGVHFTESPLARIESGRAPVRAVISGSNADEADSFVTAVPVPDEAAYRALVRSTLGPAREDAILALYPVDGFENAKAAYEHLFSDVGFICPALSFAQITADAGAAAYSYHYVHTLSGPASALGAPHGAELLPLFDGWSTLARYTPVDADIRLGELMRSQWVAFARNGRALDSWPQLPAIRLLQASPQNVETIREGRCAALAELGIGR